MNSGDYKYIWQASDWPDWRFDLAAVYNLGNLVGQPNVWVAVVLTSDSSISKPEGLYVDDLLLRKCTLAACTEEGAASAAPSTWASSASLVAPGDGLSASESTGTP